MIYFSFVDKSFGKEIESNFISDVLDKICGFIFPKANPDFEGKLKFVEKWLIEYDNEKNYVSREIGLDHSGKTIVKMPFKENIGFWGDTDLTLEDYKNNFEIKLIKKESFNEKWSGLV